MKIRLVTIVLFLSCTLASFQSAQAQETEIVADIWACSFMPGKDMDDLEIWRDFYRAQLDSLDSEEAQAVTAFMWTPRFAGAEVDLVWFEYHENLNVAARAYTAFEEGGIGPSVDGMWESILDCEGNQNFRRQIYTGSDFAVTGDSAIIETFRCNFKPGMGFPQVEEALTRWSGVVDSMPNSDEFIAFMFTPFHSGTGYEVSFYGVYDTLIDYAAQTTDYLTSNQGQAMNLRWQEILLCESRLWTGRQMM